MGCQDPKAVMLSAEGLHPSPLRHIKDPNAFILRVGDDQVLHSKARSWCAAFSARGGAAICTATLIAKSRVSIHLLHTGLSPQSSRSLQTGVQSTSQTISRSSQFIIPLREASAWRPQARVVLVSLPAVGGIEHRRHYWHGLSGCQLPKLWFLHITMKFILPLLCRWCCTVSRGRQADGMCQDYKAQCATFEWKLYGLGDFLHVLLQACKQPSLGLKQEEIRVIQTALPIPCGNFFWSCPFKFSLRPWNRLIYFCCRPKVAIQND